jgi:hypothetical protein
MVDSEAIAAWVSFLKAVRADLRRTSPSRSFDEICASLVGFDVAIGGDLLRRFQDWSSARHSRDRNLVWSSHIRTDARRLARSMPVDTDVDQLASRRLLNVLSQFTRLHGATIDTEAHPAWPPEKFVSFAGPRLGMFLEHSTYKEACSLLGGFGAGRQDAFIEGFEMWLRDTQTDATGDGFAQLILTSAEAASDPVLVLFDRLGAYLAVRS